jgi:G:T-mismatch repair DNA endonuclease (very short patch repair protein)
MLSNAEKQRRFKERMYEAGFKQIVIWVKRKEAKNVVKMKQSGFMKRLEKVISGWHDSDVSELYNLFIKIASAKKEVIRLRRTGPG